MTGQMYQLKFHNNESDEFIIVETLTNIVALMNARTNNIHWITKHILGLEYVKKVNP